MSQVLTVPTHFNDIGELSAGFLDRVERDTLILYGPVAYEESSQIQFVVLLADGTPALEGMGVVRAAVDGGADRVPETRYDIVVEALELEGRYEVVFERLVLARQAVSEPPVPDPEENEPTGELDAAPTDDGSADDPSTDGATGDEARAYVNEVELNADEVFSLAPNDVDSVAPGEYDSDLPEESAVETEPPDETDDEPQTSIEEVEDDFADEDELDTVVAAVDPEAMMAVAEEAHAEEVDEEESDAEEVDEEESDEERAPDDVISSEDENVDRDYAFEHGIAEDPNVGMPVPIPSMAAPPAAPPAPPRLRLAEPPDGLARPSLAKSDELRFSTDGEVSDVHTTGLFAYEEGLPIPSRPPLPDPNGRQSPAANEAQGDSDVEESEPPESNDDEYEEVRLSDFAGAVEEG
ncbi:MAG: hypothetical protein HKN10_18090 [Myxococcales bacterium]|nr:hypothetical protein [Myxococcales bacterium]